MDNGLTYITNKMAGEIHNAISKLQLSQDVEAIEFLQQFSLEQLIYARDLARVLFQEKIEKICAVEEYMPDEAVAATFLYVAKGGYKQLSDDAEEKGKFVMTCCHSSKNFVLFLAPQTPPSPTMATAK